MSNPRRLLIVWWSDTGGTAQLVQAAFDAALAAADAETATDQHKEVANAHSPSLEVACVRCDRVLTASLLAADALILATPECLGSVAGPMKTFFDRCYYPALGRLNGKAYAVMVCAGSDGHGAVRQIERIASGWRLRPAAEPLVVITGAQTPEAIARPKHLGPEPLGRAAELGATLAAGLSMGLF